MKKETPRLLKSSSIVYAFDCFGTIFSGTPSFTISDKKSKVSFNPNVLNIRWIMIVPDSFWSRLKAKWMCLINGVSPVEIVRCRNWKQKSKNQEIPILKCLQDIADKKDIIHYIDPNKVKKVVYVNNDLKLDDAINQRIDRSCYDIVAMNLMDLWQNKFSHII